MAKAKTAAKKTAKTETVKPAAILRKGALAYVGLYGAAYQRAKMRSATLRTAANDLFGTLVEKGTEIEAQALDITKDARVKAVKTAETTSEKVRAFFPKAAANDHVAELEAEIAKLNKKVATLTKKAAKTVKAAKTEITPAAFTEAQLTKMLEKDLVVLAGTFGIEASIADLKADTIAKILTAQGKKAA